MSKQTMHPKDAAKILGINGEITPEIVKQAYRRACSKYHPDKNPAGAEMMKAVNQAYAVLKDYEEEHIEIDAAAVNYGEELNDALNAVVNLAGIRIEICGAWVWLTGDTKTHKEALKEAGYKWAHKKLAWYFRPDDYKSYSRGKYSLDQIRDKFGSKEVYPNLRPQLTA